MYTKFKKQLIKAMEIKRDLLVARTSKPKLESIFNVSTDDDKLYGKIMEEFERLAIQHVEDLLYDLCKMYGVNAEKSDNCRNFDLKIEIDGVQNYIEIKGLPIVDTMAMNRFYEMVKKTDSPVCLVYLIEPSQQSNRIFEAQASLLLTKNVSNLKVYVLEHFISELFGNAELVKFKKAMSTYKDEMHKAIGFQITEIFSPSKLVEFKATLDEELKNYNYNRIRLDRYNEHLTENPDYRDINSVNFNSIKHNYVDGGKYKIMLSDSDFAKSFLTSEWLYKKYFSLEDMDNTFVVAGYLKSIEQLLWRIVYIKGQGRMLHGETIESDNSSELDTTLGSLQYFLKEYTNDDIYEMCFGNSKTFVKNYMLKQLSEWRKSYRNGYLHKHKLAEQTRIEAIREETFFLYSLILGTISLDEDEMSLLEA